MSNLTLSKILPEKSPNFEALVLGKEEDTPLYLLLIVQVLGALSNYWPIKDTYGKGRLN